MEYDKQKNLTVACMCAVQTKNKQTKTKYILRFK